MFIGRAQELDRLLAVLDRAEQGQPAVGLVAGDAGVGKTRLLAELGDLAAKRGARVLIGGCMEAGDVGLPYVPFIDAFRDLGVRPGEAELAASMVAAVPSLGLLLPRAGDEGIAAPASGDAFERVQLFDGLLSLVVRLSELAPLLLVIEDLHWADRSTRDLLSFLVHTLRTGRVALVASYRSDELHRRHPLRPLLAELVRVSDLERLDLHPFSRIELAEQLEALTGGRVAADAVDRILARSDGNAFFAEELVAAGAVRAEVALPDALADVLLARVEALSELAQGVLKVAAVAGRRVSHRLLAEAAGRPDAELEQALRETVTGQILVVDPAGESYRFRHALLQEVVYADLLPGERSRLHATYARLLAKRGPAAELAWHCLAGHDLRGALGALVRAAAEARAVFAPAEAYQHLTRAIELWDQVPDAAEVAGIDEAELQLRAAQAASDSGEYRHAATLAKEAVATIDAAAEPLRAAMAYERLASFLIEVNFGPELLDAARRAVELVPAEPPTSMRARVTAGLAGVLVLLRDQEARRWAEEALAVARAVGSPAGEAQALLPLVILARRQGDMDTARTLAHQMRERAAAAGERSRELEAQGHLGRIELDLGNLTAAGVALDEAVTLAEASGLVWSPAGVEARILRIIAHYDAGDWDGAERLAVAVDDRSPAAAPLSAASMYVEVGRGRPSAAERFARLEPRREEDTYVAYLTGGCAADLALWQGDLDRAVTVARSTLAMLDRDAESWMLSSIWPATIGLAAEADRAEQARTAGDANAEGAARASGAAFLATARADLVRADQADIQVGPEALAWLARAEAEAERLEGRSGVAQWRAAADGFTYGYVYEEARSRWRLAEALLLEGLRDEALAEVRTAHATAERLGAEPLRAAVEALARRGRLDLGQGVPEHPGTAGHTPREREVQRLVAAGPSNSQIAGELFISPKTASVHVSNILAKLGVHSRVEAAATAYRLGLDGIHASPGS